MENYNEFLERVNEFETPDFRINRTSFRPSNSLLQKVDSDNHFCKFYGDTIVFDLDTQTENKVDELVDALYKSVPECFCDRIPKDSLHMTLHDLSSSPFLDDIAAQMDKNMKAVEANNLIFVASKTNINMRTNNIINMCDTSVVLCFVPVDEYNYLPLMTYYSLADQALRLPYPFTPHITLAYYNCHGFNEDSANRLAETVEELNCHSFDIKIRGDRLFYKRFKSMAKYSRYLRLF